MLSKTRAIVLHCLKYGETSVIVHMYTEYFGRQSVLIRGVRKNRSKIPYYLFESLNLLDIIIYRKESRELNNLKEARPAVLLQHINSDIRKSTIALFIGELLYKTLREEESNPPLFHYLFNSIQHLDICEEGLENFPLVFMIQYSKFLGIFPKNNTDLDAYKVSVGLQIADITDFNLADLPNIRLSGDNRYALLVQLLSYFSNHLEGMGQMKSFSILREVYH